MTDENLLKSQEPAVKTGLNVSFLIAIYTVVNAIWPNLLSENIQDAITKIALVLIPIVTSILIRYKVFSPASVQKLKDQIEELEAENERLKTIPR